MISGGDIGHKNGKLLENQTDITERAEEPHDIS